MKRNFAIAACLLWLLLGFFFLPDLFFDFSDRRSIDGPWDRFVVNAVLVLLIAGPSLVLEIINQARTPKGEPVVSASFRARAIKAFFDVVQYWISPQLVFWLTGRRLAADLSEAVWDAMVLFLASLPALPAGLFIFWLVARSDRETS